VSGGVSPTSVTAYERLRFFTKVCNTVDQHPLSEADCDQKCGCSESGVIVLGMFAIALAVSFPLRPPLGTKHPCPAVWASGFLTGYMHQHVGGGWVVGATDGLAVHNTLHPKRGGSDGIGATDVQVRSIARVRLGR
jgi:hypothetical protein